MPSIPQISKKIRWIIDELTINNNNSNRVRSKDIHIFLLKIEKELKINIDSNIWNIANSFIEQYSELSIDRSIFLDFINDLFKLDFINYLQNIIPQDDDYEEEEERFINGIRSFPSIIRQSTLSPSSIYSPINKPISTTGNSVLGSPLNLTENFDDVFNRDTSFNSIQKNLDDKIDEFSKGLKSPFLNLKYKKIKDEDPKDKKTVKPSKIISILSSTFILTSSFFLILNTIILSVLLGIYITQNDTIKSKIRNFFLDETSTSIDLYWWQKFTITERLIWTLLDYLQ